MNVYGYINTPIGSNDYHAQHYGILAFGASTNMAPVHFIHESTPDQLHGAKPILSGMLDNLHRGDALIVTDFSKLGGSTVEVLGVLSTLARTGVKLCVVNSGYRLEDNVEAQVVARACTLVMQIEKELQVHTEPDPAPIQIQHDEANIQTPARRTRKSKMDGRESEIESLLANGISLSKIAQTLGVSRPTLSDFVSSRNLNAQSSPSIG